MPKPEPPTFEKTAKAMGFDDSDNLPTGLMLLVGKVRTYVRNIQDQAYEAGKADSK